MAPHLEPVSKTNEYDTGIVGAPANDLLGYEGVEGAVGPRFRKLSKEVRTSGGMKSVALKTRNTLGASHFIFASNNRLVGNLLKN